MIDDFLLSMATLFLFYFLLTLGRKQNHTDYLCRKPFLWTVVLEESKRLGTVSANASYDGQSRLEGNIGGQVYITLVDKFIPCN